MRLRNLINWIKLKWFQYKLNKIKAETEIYIDKELSCCHPVRLKKDAIKKLR